MLNIILAGIKLDFLILDKLLHSTLKFVTAAKNAFRDRLSSGNSL